MLRYLTAGESHGPALVAILEGMPANLPVAAADINADLARRMGGYGRGGRMKIERDEVEILGGVRHGRTLGSPISLRISNRDWENWRQVMAVEAEAAEALSRMSRASWVPYFSAPARSAWPGRGRVTRRAAAGAGARSRAMAASQLGQSRFSITRAMGLPRVLPKRIPARILA